MKIKVTNATIVQRLTQWAQGQNLTNELIFFQNEINQQEIQQRAWDLANLRINFLPDEVVGFTKIVYVDKL
jgi:hypothetical protein